MKIRSLKFKRVKSTNDIAINLIKKNQLQPTLISSINQTKGRGTMGKKWISRKGNLFVTVFFEINQKRINFKQFAVLNALILRSLVSKIILKKIKIKWPNDLFYKKEKVCGILQELVQVERKFFLIIGIGINTVTAPKTKTFKGTSLLESSNKLIDNSKILKSLKNNYETIFRNYKFNKKLLRK